MERGWLWLCLFFFFPRRFVRVFVAEMRGDGIQERTRTGYGHGHGHGYGNGNGGPRWIFFSSPSLLLFLCLVALLDGMPLSFILFYSISVLCLARKGGQKWQGGGAARVRGPSEKGELGEGRRGGKD